MNVYFILKLSKSSVHQKFRQLKTKILLDTFKVCIMRFDGTPLISNEDKLTFFQGINLFNSIPDCKGKLRENNKQKVFMYTQQLHW